MSAAEPLQRAIYALLADETLPCPVFDAVPEDAVYPYTVIGEVDEQPDDTHTGLGALVTVALHVWSDYRGWGQTARCLNAIQGVLHRASLDVDGYEHVTVLHIGNTYQRDPDPKLRHGIGRYTARLTATPAQEQE